jgi:hypothetical protein
MKFAQRLALLAAPDLRDIARRVSDADRLLAQVSILHPTLHVDLVEQARSILDGIHVDLAGRSIR